MTSTTVGPARPDVSVLFLACQQEAWVGDAVRSVLGQQGVVSEIILSDDASTDRTFAVMQAAAAGYAGPHRLRLRRNPDRLGIDHIVQLVELAGAEVMVMAHGDDLSEPHRCRRLLDEFERTGARVISSNYLEIDAAGRPNGLNLAAGESRDLPAEEIARTGWQRTMYGATLAWRREVYSEFPRLDAAYLPIGHDTLIPFRGALLGGMRYLHEPLLRYRRHAGQWSVRLHDHRSRELWQESQYGTAMMARLAMRRDLRDRLARADAGEHPRLETLQHIVEESILQLCADWVGVRTSLYREGWRPSWVPRADFERSARRYRPGALRDLARRLYRRLRWQILFHR